MRKITEDSVKAFIKGYSFKRSNTEVKYIIGEDKYVLLLHGNRIAERKVGTGKVYISCAGWLSITTKERLNGLLTRLGYPRIYQRDYVWYWRDGEKFDTSSFQEII